MSLGQDVHSRCALGSPALTSLGCTHTTACPRLQSLPCISPGLTGPGFPLLALQMALPKVVGGGVLSPKLPDFSH